MPLPLPHCSEAWWIAAGLGVVLVLWTLDFGFWSIAWALWGKGDRHDVTCLRVQILARGGETDQTPQ